MPVRTCWPPSHPGTRRIGDEIRVRATDPPRAFTNSGLVGSCASIPGRGQCGSTPSSGPISLGSVCSMDLRIGQEGVRTRWPWPADLIVPTREASILGRPATRNGTGLPQRRRPAPLHRRAGGRTGDSGPAPPPGRALRDGLRLPGTCHVRRRLPGTAKGFGSPWMHALDRGRRRPTRPQPCGQREIRRLKHRKSALRAIAYARGCA